MTKEEFNEQDILAGCIKNDRRSQELLYRRFSKKMYAICMSYAGDRPMAQDILQESFIKVFKNIKQYKNDGSLEGWIRRITSNTAIDHLRKNKRTDEFIDSGHYDREENASNSALKIIGFKELMGLVERLPSGAKMVFNMHALDGYTHKEIARKLEITEGTSKSQFNRARKLLVNIIGNMNL